MANSSDDDVTFTDDFDESDDSLSRTSSMNQKRSISNRNRRRLSKKISSDSFEMPLTSFRPSRSFTKEDSISSPSGNNWNNSYTSEPRSSFSSRTPSRFASKQISRQNSIDWTKEYESKTCQWSIHTSRKYQKNLSFFGGFTSYKMEILSKNGLISPRLHFELVKPQKEDVIEGQLKDLRNWLIKRQSCHHTETSQLIWRANELASFHMMETLAFNELMNITGVYTERKVYRNKVVSYRYVKEREYSI